MTPTRGTQLPAVSSSSHEQGVHTRTGDILAMQQSSSSSSAPVPHPPDFLASSALTAGVSFSETTTTTTMPPIRKSRRIEAMRLVQARKASDERPQADREWRERGELFLMGLCVGHNTVFRRRLVFFLCYCSNKTVSKAVVQVQCLARATSCAHMFCRQIISSLARAR